MRRAIFLIFITIINNSFSQILQSYISQTQQIFFDTIKNSWYLQNQIQNRLKINIRPTTNTKFNTEIRSRLMYGDLMLFYKNTFKKDKGLINLKLTIFEFQNGVFLSNIDRLFFKYYGQNFELTLGRQRINWSKTFVWNPNDLFNTFSFFEIDYPEKPGTDAIYFQYFPTTTSNLDFVLWADSSKKANLAVRHNFNFLKTDFQYLVSKYNNELAIGIGFSTNIYKLNIRSEATYLHSFNKFFDTSGQIISSIGIDLIISNKFTFLSEFLYNPFIRLNKTSNLTQLFYSPTDIKKLSIAEYNFLNQLTYSPNETVNVGFGVFWMQKNWYGLLTNIKISISQNIDFLLYVQNFKSEIYDITNQTLKPTTTTILVFNLKYDF